MKGKRKRPFWKRLVTLMLVTSMLIGTTGTSSFAALGEGTPDAMEHVHNEDGWVCSKSEDEKELNCAHEHNEECGYQEAVEAADCSCGAEADEDGNVTHSEDCAYTEAAEGVECRHEHTEDCYAVVSEGVWDCAEPEETSKEEPEETSKEEPEETFKANVEDAEDASEEETKGGLEEEAQEEELQEEEAQEEEPQEKTEDKEVSETPGEQPAEEALEEDIQKEEVPAEAEENIPAEVKAFLNAMAGLPNASEVTADNAVKIGDMLNSEDISDGYALASNSGEEEGWMTGEIRTACAKYEELFLAVSAVTDMESEKYYSDPDIFPNKTVAQVNNEFSGLGGKGADGNLTNDGGTITKYVGESGFYRRCPLNRLSGNQCGHLMMTLAPEGYCEFTVNYTDSQVISAINYGVGRWNGDGFDNVPCLQANFYAQKPGSTTVSQNYYVNFLQDYGVYRCGTCNRPTQFPKDYTWHQYKDTFEVTVKARYQLDYDSQGGSNVNSTYKDVAATSATLSPSGTPTKEGYTFEGWAESPNGSPVSSVTLNWTEGYGSKDNPVAKTLYAKWKPAKTYTVVYTDGKDGESFGNESHGGLFEGDATPAFNNGSDPTLSGFTFMGWAPAVNPVVSVEDADENGIITYMATWKKNSTGGLTVIKTPSKEYPIMGEAFSYKITVKNSKNEDVQVTITDQLNVNLNFVSADNGGEYDQETRTVTWNNVIVPANGFQTVSVTVKAKAVGKIFNEAKVGSESDNTSGNTTVTAVREFVLIYHEKLISDKDETQVTNMPTPLEQVEKSTEMSETLKVSDTVPLRDGYTFVNWQWGGDPSKSFKAGTEITLTAPTKNTNRVTADLYAVWEKDTADKPAPPTPQEVNKEVWRGDSSEGASVLVYCKPGNHQVGRFNCYSTTDPKDDHTDRIEIGKVQGDAEKGYTCKVTFLAEKYREAFSVLKKSTHELVSGETNKIVQFVWDAAENKWKLASGQSAPVEFYMTCVTPASPKLTGLQKERLTAAPAGVTLDLQGKTVNYNQNVVFVGDNAPEVTLLYKITVTGTKDAKYKVTDNGATWVGGDKLTGTLDNSGKAVIYVTKTFTKDDVSAEGKLTNNATLESDGGNTEGPGPGNGDATGEADAKRNFKVTINFKTDEGEELRDSEECEVEEGNDFSYNMDQPGNRSVIARSADTTAVVIPRTITKDGRTYVLDEVASADGLKKLDEAKNITADVVADIIYSLDANSDGIPDKYQVKVTFKVVNGAWNNGSKDDVVVYVEKKNNGTYSPDGTAVLGDIIPAAGDKPDTGCKTGSWDVTPEKTTAITGDTTYIYTYAKVQKHTVTVRYMCDVNKQPFNHNAKYSYELAEGESYNHSVEPGNTTYPLVDGFNPETRSPELFTIPGGNTWAFDEVLTTSALSGTMGDKDILIEVWYSKDLKGGSDPGKDEGGSDGIPDKYQAKLVYQATEGGTQNGVSGYVTIKDQNGQNSTTGTVTVEAAAAPLAGYYFEKWTADAAGDSDFDHADSPDAALRKTIAGAKGGAVYTFTANFQARTVLNILIKGAQETKTYNGSEQTVTGYTLEDQNGNEISLPDGLSVIPSADSAKAAGTDVGTYNMGLDQVTFELTGTEACKYTANFTVIDGYLTITESDALAVSAGNVSAVYDGQGHPIVDPEVKAGETPITNADITVVYTDENGNELRDADGNPLVPVDAGTYTAKITAKVPGYEDAEYTAVVTIRPRGLTVTTANASKTYDGTALTNSTAAVTGAVDGETITATATGSQTEVGSSANGYTINWGSAKESNYLVNAVLGTLTVNAVPETPVPPVPTDPTTPDNPGGAETPDPTPTPAEPTPTPAEPTPTPAEPTPTPAEPAPTPAEPTPTPAEPTPTPAEPTPTPAEPTPAPAEPAPAPTAPVAALPAAAVPAALAAVPPAPAAVTPVPATPAPAVPDAPEEDEEVELEDENVPLADEPETQPEDEKLAELEDEEVPLAVIKSGSWALINFALMNLAVYESLMLLFGYFVQMKKASEENDRETERKLKKKGIVRVVSLPIALISVIVFCLTEDITLSTGFADRYTFVMVMIAILQTAVVTLSRKKEEEKA